MKRRPRIAIGRLAQETNALSPVATTLDDFRRTHLFEGERLLEVCSKKGVEVAGFLRDAELSGAVAALASAGAEVVPTTSAWAIPSGPLERETFDDLASRIVEGLRRQGPLDGVLLSLHGAMGVRGLRDPEGALLARVREVVGADVPIAATYDLHANTSRARIAATDVTVAYLTNPHRDHARTGAHAARALLRVVEGARPTTAWRSLPMVLGGGTTVDFLPPMLPIFLRLRGLRHDPRVLAASVFPCHPWLDEPSRGWSVVVTTAGEPALAEALADELAERCWAVRDVPPPRFPHVKEAIALAREARLARALGVVCMSDASDVVAAGAPGENVALLEALLEGARDLTSYVPLRDPDAVARLFHVKVGERVRTRVGGSLDREKGRSIEVEGHVLRVVSRDVLGRVVVLDLGHVKLVLTEGPPLSMKPAFYRDLGLRMRDADVVVVKSFFPFRLYYFALARRSIYVRTAGATDLDGGFTLPADGPLAPRDAVDDWRPRDRARRAAR